jgi:biopolymer transport protein ExbD
MVDHLLPKPAPRRARFMLTPLVDVMFLLLIFFMLSSETALYTLLRLNARSVQAQSALNPKPSSQAELLIAVGRGTLRVNGVATPLLELAAVLARYKASGITAAVLVPQESAQAQDVVAVIELFEMARFAQVRMVSAPVPAP